MPRKRKEEVTMEPGKGLNLDPELIKQLAPGTLDRATINEQLAALKLIWLALRNIVAKWTGSRHDWKSAMTQFALLHPERFNIGV